MKTLSKATKTAKYLFLFFSIHLCIISNATTYYISSSSGNDANSGISPTTPWKTLKKVNAMRTLAPGDIILLKAGDKFEGPIKIGSAGVALKPIRVGRYGAGVNPIIYGDHPGNSWSAVSGHPGVFVTNVYGGSLKEVYGSDGSYYYMSKRGTLSLDRWLDTMSVNKWGYDIALKTTYIKTAKGTLPPVVHLYEFAVLECYKNYVVFENLDIRNGNIGISVGGAGSIVRNNTISDMVYHGIYMPSAYGNEVSNNTITRTGETSILLRSAQNNWVHHNKISNSMGTILGVPIVLRRAPERAGIGAFFGKNNLVEKNTLSNIYSSFFDYWYEANTVTRFNYGYNAGAATTQGGTKLQLYGNIFSMNGGKGISADYEYDLRKNPLAEVGPVLIFNNVVRDFINYGLCSVSFNVNFRNNIIVTSSTQEDFLKLARGSSSDYNCYYVTKGAYTNWNCDGKGYSSLAALRSATGQDGHSLFADPKFISSTTLSPNDFKLSASSPCINKGMNLKSAGLISFSYTDFLGLSIPQASIPDMGAYEYSATSTNLNSVVDVSPFSEKSFYKNYQLLQKNEPVIAWGK